MRQDLKQHRRSARAFGFAFIQLLGFCVFQKLIDMVNKVFRWLFFSGAYHKSRMKKLFIFFTCFTVSFAVTAGNEESEFLQFGGMRINERSVEPFPDFFSAACESFRASKESDVRCKGGSKSDASAPSSFSVGSGSRMVRGDLREPQSEAMGDQRSDQHAEESGSNFREHYGFLMIPCALLLYLALIELLFKYNKPIVWPWKKT